MNGMGSVIDEACNRGEGWICEIWLILSALVLGRFITEEGFDLLRDPGFAVIPYQLRHTRCGGTSSGGDGITTILW